MEEAMTDGLVVPTQFVALSPIDLGRSQQGLIDWCHQKAQRVHAELADFRENLAIAKKNGWRTATLANAVRRTEKVLVYYDKIRAALEAGYLIVPNFPVNVFAVRTDKHNPPRNSTENAWARHPAEADVLPAGEGRYVGGQVLTRDESYTEKLPDGKEKRVTVITDVDFDDVAFPVSLARPVILAATARAMALKSFDQIGLVQPNPNSPTPTRGDPIVVGRILAPQKGYTQKIVTFFVAWWLDPETL